MQRKIKQVVWEGVGGKYTPDENSLIQLKYDGSQYHLHLWNGKPFALTSRRISKRTGLLNEKLDHFINLKGKILLKGISAKKLTIIVVEVSADHLYEEFKAGKIKDKRGNIVPWARRSNYVAGIMNSNVENMQAHNLKMIAFDLMYYGGKNIEDWGYIFKYNKLVNMCLPMDLDIGVDYGSYSKKQANNSKNILFVVSNINLNTTLKTYTPKQILKHILKAGYDVEGLIFKDKYSNKNLKVKIERDADCIVIGYIPGKNKYKGLVGSLIVGVFINDAILNPAHKYNKHELSNSVVQQYLLQGYIVTVGKISGFTYAVRKNISNHKKYYIGKVVHCEYMQWTGKKMRHPRIGNKEFRDDKLIKRCTMNQFG